MAPTAAGTSKTTSFVVLLLLVASGSAQWVYRSNAPKPSQPSRTIQDNDDVANRIVAGNETTIEKYPHQVALEGGGRHICGGSILSADWALTAAHCVYDQPVKWLAFRAGSSRREQGGTVHHAKYYIYHEKFIKKMLDYDVAVVFVKEPFILGAMSMPVVLPLRQFTGGGNVVVTGWGYLQPQLLTKPRQLQKAELIALDWVTCSKIYPGQITKRMMCADDPAKKQDICSGDSGGPLIVTGSRLQVGIVSWSHECADEMPSVFTNVSTVASWIRKTVGFDDPFVFFD